MSAPQSEPTGKSIDEKIHKGAKDFANRFKGVMKDLTEDDIGDWEEEFDNLFNHLGFDHIEFWGEISPRSKLKSFISTVREQAKREERERIEAVFKRKVPPHGLNLEDGVWLKRLLNEAFKKNK